MKQKCGCLIAVDVGYEIDDGNVGLGSRCVVSHGGYL